MALILKGMPPVWNPPADTPKLKQDSGVDIFRDINAARYPEFPMEPAVQALFVANPKLKTGEIDVVGCGSTMGNLLRFARSIDKSFRIYCERIGNTIFLIRMEKTPTEKIEGVVGYGHSFPEAYTQWDSSAANSLTHQRLIRYKFGDFDCIIRSEGDGFLRSGGNAASGRSPTSSSSVGTSSHRESIISLLEKTQSISVGERAANPDSRLGLTIRTGGREISQAQIFDLKTRSLWKNIDMEEFYPRLWVVQIPNFILARHKSGKFVDIKVEDKSVDIHDWETRNQTSLRILNNALREISNTLRQRDCNKLEVRRIGSGPLQLRKLHETRWAALPDDLKTRWADDSTVLGTSIATSGNETDSSEGENASYLKF